MQWAHLISKRIGVPIQLVQAKTIEEKIKLSQEKKCDIFNSMSETPKRKNWLNFTNSIFEDPNVIIARNDFEYIEDLSKLKNKTIAVPKDSYLHEFIERDFPNLKIVHVENFEDAFYLVQNKAADITVNPLITTAYSMKNEHIFNLKIVAKSLKYRNELKIAVLKEEPILLDILNKAIKTITKKEQDNIINEHTSIKIPQNNEYIKFFIYALFSIIFITFIIIFWNYQLRKKIQIEIKKNSEQQNLMFQQSKQAELGNLIASISHQWRDSLTKIGYINLNLRVMVLNNKEIPSEFLDKSTLQIENSLDFMSETMQNFLDFYKPSSNISEFEVYDSINSALSIIDTKIKNSNLSIEFKGDFDTKIKGIRNEWMQVWINIIINSINISIERNIKDPKIEITINKNEIIFEDNCGKIEEELLRKINNDEYSGLGLKMSKQIAQKNNQNMIISNSSNGAIFKFISLH